MKNTTSPNNQSVFNNPRPTPGMTGINFLYWLHGAMELSEKRKFTKKQVDMIKAHLKLVKDNPALTGWFEGFLATQNKNIQGEAYEVLEKKINENFTNLSQFNLPDLGTLLKRSPDPLDRIIC